MPFSEKGGSDRKLPESKKYILLKKLSIKISDEVIVEDGLNLDEAIG